MEGVKRHTGYWSECTETLLLHKLRHYSLRDLSQTHSIKRSAYFFLIHKSQQVTTKISNVGTRAIVYAVMSNLAIDVEYI